MSENLGLYEMLLNNVVGLNDEEYRLHLDLDLQLCFIFLMLSYFRSKISKLYVYITNHVSYGALGNTDIFPIYSIKNYI